MSVECLKHSKIKFGVYYYSLSSFQLNEKCYLDRIVLALHPGHMTLKQRIIRTIKSQERKGLYQVGASTKLPHCALTIIYLKDLCVRSLVS